MADIRKRVGTKGVTWQVRFNDPNTGKSRYKTFPLRKHADAFLTDLNHSTYIHDNDTISLSDAVERWLDVCENTGRKGREPVEKATLRKYKEHAEIIRNMIGNVKLNGLTSVFCNNFRDDLLRLYSRKYAKKILTSFKSILSQARIDGRLRHDPAEGTAIIISQRSEKKEEMDIPSLLEVKALLDKANKLEGSKNQKIQKAWRRYCPFFMVLAYSGMRPGEALGQIKLDRFTLCKI